MKRVRTNRKDGAYEIMKVHKDGREEWDGGQIVMRASFPSPSLYDFGSFGYKYKLVEPNLSPPLTITWTLNIG